MVDRRNSIPPAIAALAGRRIDPQDADDLRFPLSEAEHVVHKLLRRFRQERVVRLVCSAACGADILALEAANELAIPATVILPLLLISSEKFQSRTGLVTGASASTGW